MSKKRICAACKKRVWFEHGYMVVGNDNYHPRCYWYPLRPPIIRYVVNYDRAIDEPSGDA